MSNSKLLAYAIIILIVGVNISVIGDIRATNYDDTTPPVTTCILDPSEPNGENGWYVSDVEVTLNATDDMSGVNVTEYRVDGGSIQMYTEPFNVTVDGQHMVEYRSVDYAGNVEDWKSVEFKIDQTEPTIDLTWEVSGNSIQGWVVTWTATCDDDTSGVERVEFYLNDILQFTDTSEPYEFIVEWPLVPPDKHSVVGFICNRRFKEQNVAFYALLVLYSYHLPGFTFTVIAYDFAGNSESDYFIFDGLTTSNIHKFERFTFPNDYTGKIGFFFINAYFEDGPLFSI